ncbi:MAG: type II toxin-antitoxin system Phd/YefM family antitoxin [Bacteroidetes bacterium]|nr:type II toxin-antitoxin system Phd/YefM family antitoxin [Bacteroidota bacterium]MCH7769549.1 type II toxin-antitoxin system Phd/YefM family antitoxin [Bacteroidota bacterium]
MVKLHPNILEQNGKKQFAVIPYEEFLKLQEELSDYEDLKELRQAKEAERNAPTVTLKEAKKELGI